MTPATIILISALLLGAAVLYIATKNQWSWKKFFLWPLFTLFGLGVLGGLGYFFYSEISNRPKLQEKFWGISLETDKSDIKYMKGEPTSILKDGRGWGYTRKTGYSKERSLYLIGFQEEKIKYVLFAGTDWQRSPDLQGIRLGASFSTIKEKFGKPSHVSVSKNELQRTFSFERFHVFFTLEKESVIDYGIYNPEFGPKKSPQDKLLAPNKSVQNL